MDTTKLFIDGAWIEPSTADTIDVVNPATEEIICTVPAGGADDARIAAEAARGAFAGWSATEPKARADILSALCESLRNRSDELVDLMVQEIGMPRATVRAMQVDLALVESKYHIDRLREFSFEQECGNSILIHEPVGVVAAITPWNYPLTQLMRKVVPAMATGCCVIAKPSELAPLSAFVLAESMEAVGVPAGVFNLITGFGQEVGEALVKHPDVDMISLTGSTLAGKRVAELASQSIKRIALELGGKSPAVILDDADLEAAIQGTLNWTYLNSGQTCSAFTRMLVPQDRLAQAEEIAVRLSQKHVVGLPDEEGSTMGPLISAAQRDKVLQYIDSGVREGARLILDGRMEPVDGKGYFVSPTIFSDVTSGMRIEREEIFGPVLAILPYATEEEALQIANDTPYGLHAAVWSADRNRARALAAGIRAGQIEINGGEFNPFAPHGGFKESGIGRENGEFGFGEFLEVKSLQL